MNQVGYSVFQQPLGQFYRSLHRDDAAVQVWRPEWEYLNHETVIARSLAALLPIDILYLIPLCVGRTA